MGEIQMLRQLKRKPAHELAAVSCAPWQLLQLLPLSAAGRAAWRGWKLGFGKVTQEVSRAWNWLGTGITGLCWSLQQL
jgi:hypothetical protein